MGATANIFILPEAYFAAVFMGMDLTTHVQKLNWKK
jgi:hypothetical protein